MATIHRSRSTRPARPPRWLLAGSPPVGRCRCARTTRPASKRTQRLTRPARKRHPRRAAWAPPRARATLRPGYKRSRAHARSKSSAVATRRARNPARGTLGQVGSIFRRRDPEAFEQWRDRTTEAAPEPASPEPQVSGEHVTNEATLAWSTAPAGDVPPWRREDRALVDGARA